MTQRDEIKFQCPKCGVWYLGLRGPDTEDDDETFRGIMMKLLEDGCPNCTPEKPS
jgi:hypothetical protein